MKNRSIEIKRLIGFTADLTQKKREYLTGKKSEWKRRKIQKEKVIENVQKSIKGCGNEGKFSLMRRYLVGEGEKVQEKNYGLRIVQNLQKTSSHRN